MSGFDVTAAELEATGAELHQVEGEIRAAVAALHADMEALLGSGWRGGAANGFSHGWTQWRAGADQVLTALSEMGTILGLTGQGYQQTEVDSTGVVTQSGAVR